MGLIKLSVKPATIGKPIRPWTCHTIATIEDYYTLIMKSVIVLRRGGIALTTSISPAARAAGHGKPIIFMDNGRVICAQACNMIRISRQEVLTRSNHNGVENLGHVHSSNHGYRALSPIFRKQPFSPPT